jgi:hypothetical protein
MPRTTLDVHIPFYRIVVNIDGDFLSLERPLLNVHKFDIQFSIELAKKIKELANLQLEIAKINEQQENLKLQKEMGIKNGELKNHLDAFWKPYLPMISKKTHDEKSLR